MGARPKSRNIDVGLEADGTSYGAFWTVAAAIALVMAANSTPTPLYVDYQQRWGFSSSTLTAVFAIYAGGVLVTLLLAGGLSDRVGRRPVLMSSMVLLILSYVLFLLADDVAWLYLARALQGLATGLFTGAAGAALIDLHPHADRRVAGLVNSTFMPLGLAVGAPLSGALAEWAPMPLRTPYLVLVALSLLAFVAIAVSVPETVSTDRRMWGSLVRLQRLSVPAEIRGPFIIAGLGVAAAWSVGGLYLGLAGSLAAELLHGDNHFVSGLVILSMQGVSAVAQLIWNLRANSESSAVASGVGCAALFVGMPAVALSVLAGSPVLFFAGAMVTGVGFGLAFMGSARRVAEVAPPDRRGESLAAFFVVAYVAFSIPVIAAGFLATTIGLPHALYVFAVVVAVVAAVAMVLMFTTARTLAHRTRETGE